MIFTEDDVDFLKLSDREFEETCFDLLLSLGYRSLVWRQGGSDGGRDIEGHFDLQNHLVGSYNEKWFFECKRYEKGVPPEELNSKIAWADAERPDHLVILTSSYITNGARAWLDKIGPQKPYAIRVVEGKALKKLIARFPEIVSRHFLSQEMKLLMEAQRNWLVHGILPGPQTLSLLVSKVDFGRVSANEAAFLWCSAKLQDSDIEAWFEYNEPFYMDFLFKNLAVAANYDIAVISEQDDVMVEKLSSGGAEWEVVYNKHLVAEIVLYSSTKPRRALYAFVRDNEGEGVETLVEATSDFHARIRYIKNDVKNAEQKASQLLFDTWRRTETQKERT